MSRTHAAMMGTLLAWLYLARPNIGGVFIASFGVVILARLLSPSDFGIVAMASVVTGFAHIFRDFGTVAAVIQRREL